MPTSCRIAAQALAVALAVVAAGCATGRPGWVASPPEIAGYATVVGAATQKATRQEARRAAEAAAIAQLTSRFGFTSQLSYRETNSLAEGRQVEERLETASPKVRLEAPEAIARFDECDGRGRWSAYVLVRYPLAAIRRERERLASAQEGRRLAAAVALGRARTALAEGAAGEALLHLEEARSADAEPVVRQQAEAELHRVAAGLRLEPLRAGEPQATLAGLAEPLRLRVSLAGVAAAGLSIRFRFAAGKGELDHELARTDSGGLASCRVGELEPAARYVVVAEVQLPAAGAEPLRAASAEFRFALKRVPWRVAIDIAEYNLEASQPQPVVAAVLADQLTAAGVAIAADHKQADVVVTGLATTHEGSDNLGWENAAVADVRLKAVLAAEGRVLAERQVSLADFSDSVEQAGRNALRRAAASAARAVLQGLICAAP